MSSSELFFSELFFSSILHVDKNNKTTLKLQKNEIFMAILHFFTAKVKIYMIFESFSWKRPKDKDLLFWELEL